MLFIHKTLAELKLNYNWEIKPDVLGKMYVPVLIRPPEIPEVALVPISGPRGGKPELRTLLCTVKPFKYLHFLHFLNYVS
jgi:hypothetical protein